MKDTSLSVAGPLLATAAAIVTALLLSAQQAAFGQDTPLVPVPDLTVPSTVEPGLAPVLPMPDASLSPAAPEAAITTIAAEVSDEDAMLRGPVHEAFAEQLNQDPVEGLIIPREPPVAVEELAPDVRPEGRQVEWISGYWSWDDDDQDFFWVSGIWREVPQGFRWVPGYWTQVDTGWQWVGGTWVSVETEEIQYVETAPPQTLELGPVGDAPSTTHIWIPGCWNYQTTRYVWRPGYWSGGYSNWVWIPARYNWTPRGYFYCNGYWDYPIARRGCLFAPYRFRNYARWNRGYRFTPRVIVAANLLQWNFWVRPRYRHYYFGDYYDNAYLARGFQPWHRCSRQRGFYDPLFAYSNRSFAGTGRDFYRQVDQRFDLLSRDVDRRPFRGFSNANRQLVSDRIDDLDVRPGALGTTLQDHVREAGAPRFVKLDDSVRERVQQESQRVREISLQRREIERDVRRSADVVRDRVEDAVGSGRDAVADIKPTDRPEREPRLPRTDGDSGRDRTDRNDADGKSGDAVVDTSEAKPALEEKPARDAADSRRADRADRPDRLKLPPVAREGRVGSDAARGADSGAVASDSERPKRDAPDSPVTRGERPLNIDETISRARERMRERTTGTQDQVQDKVDSVTPEVRDRVNRTQDRVTRDVNSTRGTVNDVRERATESTREIKSEVTDRATNVRSGVDAATRAARDNAANRASRSAGGESSATSSPRVDNPVDRTPRVRSGNDASSRVSREAPAVRDQTPRTTPDRITPEVRSGIRSEPRNETRSIPRTESRPEPRMEQRTVPRSEPRSEPRSSIRSEAPRVNSPPADRPARSEAPRASEPRPSRSDAGARAGGGGGGGRAEGGARAGGAGGGRRGKD